MSHEITETDRAVSKGVDRIRDEDGAEMAAFGLHGRPEEPLLDQYAYAAGVEISRGDPPFAALIMAALLRADSTNARILRATFPGIAAIGQARYDAPGGILPSTSAACCDHHRDGGDIMDPCQRGTS